MYIQCIGLSPKMIWSLTSKGVMNLISHDHVMLGLHIQVINIGKVRRRHCSWSIHSAKEHHSILSHLVLTTLSGGAGTIYWWMVVMGLHNAEIVLHNAEGGCHVIAQCWWTVAMGTYTADRWFPQDCTMLMGHFLWEHIQYIISWKISPILFIECTCDTK